MNKNKKFLIIFYYYLTGFPEICDYCGVLKEKYYRPNPYADDSQYYQKCCLKHIIEVEGKNFLWHLNYWKIHISWWLVCRVWRGLILRKKY